MEHAKLYLDLSDEVRAVLKKHGANVSDILKKAGIEATVKTEQLPGTDTRSVVPVVDVTALILAGSFGVVSLTTATAIVLKAISDFLDRKARRELTKQVSYKIPEELRDAAGNLIRDKHGKVQFKETPVHEFIVPEIPIDDSIDMTAKNGELIARLGLKKDN
jgi:hypothetical protein